MRAGHATAARAVPPRAAVHLTPAPPRPPGEYPAESAEGEGSWGAEPDGALHLALHRVFLCPSGFRAALKAVVARLLGDAVGSTCAPPRARARQREPLREIPAEAAPRLTRHSAQVGEDSGYKYLM